MKSPSLLSMKQKKSLVAGVVTLSAALAILVIDEELNSLRAGYTNQSIRRALSLDLGGGKCEWKEPLRVVPEDTDFDKTLLVGFPSGDKRMAYVQMEALTGLPSKDDWDFVFNGYSNAPFIKTNYPHPSAVWSWDKEADQVALVVQYIRRSMVEYSDIMWYLSFEADYETDQHDKVAVDQNNKDKDKIVICRRTESVNNPWEEIEVSTSALQAHMNHGDFIGKCEDLLNILSSESEYNKNQDKDKQDVEKDLHEKITICHHTACDKNPWVEIEVIAGALHTHLTLNQGDFIGSCAQNPEFVTKKWEYNKGREKLEVRYGQRHDVNNFYIWRDQHVIQEIYKYGWYIDYWMENGLLRDPFTHKEICHDEWEALYNCPKHIQDVHDKVVICHRTASKTNPWVQLEISSSALQSHLNHGDFIGNCEDAAKSSEFVTLKSLPPAVNNQCVRQDPNCAKITGTCRPKQIISPDRLRDYTRGPTETAIIGDMLLQNKNMAKYVINKKTWPCIWDKVVAKNEGPMTFGHRNTAEDPNFSRFMLEEMIGEVTRLRNKYNASYWKNDANAIRLVSLLSEHLPLLESELAGVISGARTLTHKDIYGPGERQAIAEKITG